MSSRTESAETVITVPFRLPPASPAARDRLLSYSEKASSKDDSVDSVESPGVSGLLGLGMTGSGMEGYSLVKIALQDNIASANDAF
jgi:hypothetical protein